jgi:serine/threonine protein phosphatase PrpC
MKYELFEDIGNRKRQSGGINEDSVGAQVIEQRHRGDSRVIGLFVVADGAGGHDCGDVASYIATTTILENLGQRLLSDVRSLPTEFGIDADDLDSTDQLGGQEIVRTIDDAIAAAHTEILRYARDSDVTAHSTVTVCVRSGRHCYYGYVGDSPLYIINEDSGTIEPVFTPHSRIDREVEAQKLDEVEALVHPDSNKISRALGGSPYKSPEQDSVEVDTGRVGLYDDDTVLLTSDGLTDAANTRSRMNPLYEAYQRTDDKATIAERIREEMVTESDIRDVVLDARDLATAADDLVRFANDHGGKDNISGVLFRDPSLPASPSDRPSRGVEASSIVDRTTQIY